MSANSTSERGNSKPGDPRRQLLAGDLADCQALLDGQHADPHRLLGPHAATLDGESGVVLRVQFPAVESVAVVLPSGDSLALEQIDPRGLWAAWLPAEQAELAYRLQVVEQVGGEARQIEDPYRFPPSLGEVDLYLLGEGTHWRLWESLGARPRTLLGVAGFAVAVWAANAQRVSLVGDFCNWDGRRYPMRRLGNSGVFEIFIPELETGELYKFEILGADGEVRLKADPLAVWAEQPPETASRTFSSAYSWSDQAWLTARRELQPGRAPMHIYEVHLASWRHRDGQLLSYRELAPLLVEHLLPLGFNYLELLPISEHPYGGSWGYQVTGYYAPTSRHGDPDDFRFFVDHCHQHGIGVILDWVPGHFVTDAHGLAKFDGTALYEHADPRRGLHPDWGTLIFNLGRYEVRNFLIANALYWLDVMHIDGLRVDAVASMLYLDYSRKEGEWLANERGGRENLEAISFLQAVNQRVHEEFPGCFTLAEESTSWPGVTKSPTEGGLGFDLKWNLGWMHDTLSYLAVDPLFRSGCHDQLTFAMVYEYSECFLNPLSHDEVVHGKGSLQAKMYGDPWQQLANLRLLYAYQLSRPGKKLLFMGSELAPRKEWAWQGELDWQLLEDADHQGIYNLLCDLGKLYQSRPCLWQSDPDPEGFRWLSCDDRQRSVIAYQRRSAEDSVLVVLNLTPVPRPGYSLGVPHPGPYRLLLSSDDERYGGSGYATAVEPIAGEQPRDEWPATLPIDLPPLAALILEPVADGANCGPW